MKCPSCGYDTIKDKFNKWKTLSRVHSVIHKGKKFKAHVLFNGNGKWFGYVIEELEVEQEYFKTYRGDMEYAISCGTVSRSLEEAKAKLIKMV